MASRSVTYGAAALAAGAGIVGVGLGTILGGLVRDALKAELAVDDGPDHLLSEPTHPVERRTVRTADGTRINVVGYGEDTGGDIIVAAHGWSCNTSYWYPQVNDLAKSTRVYAYDQRGHGDSERGRARPTMAMLGQDLDAVLAEVVPPGRRAILLGHSMGGMTIMSWAAQYPQRVTEVASSVVLTSTAAKAAVQNHELIPVDLPRFTKPFAPLASRVIMGTPMPLPHAKGGARVSHYVALGPNARRSHVEFVDEMILACSPRARAGWGSAMGKLDVVSGLHNLRVPTTVVVGSHDRLTPAKHAEQIAEVLRGTGYLRDLVVLEGVGHMSSIEAATTYNELLNEILDEVSSPSLAQVD